MTGLAEGRRDRAGAELVDLAAERRRRGSAYRSMVARLALVAAGLLAAVPSGAGEGVAESAAAQPAEVGEFLDRRELCTHFRGEEPYDEERRRSLERRIGEHCPGERQELDRLMAKYRDEPAVWELLLDAESRPPPPGSSIEERLIEWTRFVAGPGFTVEATAERFGPVSPRRGVRTIRLEPRSSLFRRVGIQTYRETRLSALMLDFGEPVDVDFAPLVAAFGEPRETPRVHFDDPVPWKFDFPGGWMILETDASDRRSSYLVSGVHIRRQLGR